MVVDRQLRLSSNRKLFGVGGYTLPGDAVVINRQMKIQKNLTKTALTGTGNVTVTGRTG